MFQIGRRPVDAPEKVMRLAREHARTIFEGDTQKTPKHDVYSRIKIQGNLKMSEKAIYTFAMRHKNSVSGLQHPAVDLRSSFPDGHETEAGSDSSFSDNNNADSEAEKDVEYLAGDASAPCHFSVHITKENWNLMKPSMKTYNRSDQSRMDRSREYAVLEKGVWTDIVAQAVWLKRKYPCTWSFKKHYIGLTPDALYFLRFRATCACGGTLTGVINNPPPQDVESNGVDINLVSSKIRNSDHSGVRKRCVTGTLKIINVFVAILKSTMND